jgi:PTH1 family peptidyl-tRNA hydrolase
VLVGICEAVDSTILRVLGFWRRFLRRFRREPVDPFEGLAREHARLIVGLGNPGPEYAATRHNIGFRCVDELAQRCGARWQPHAPSQSHIAVAPALVLAKPQTFMNRSGTAISGLLAATQLPSDRVLVVYDEMDLPLGTLRLRERGSPGTHNGMRSVVRELGTEEVPRLRIGISQATPGAAIDHVLSEFAPDEQEAVDALVGRAADAALAWANEGAAVAMNRYNRV